MRCSGRRACHDRGMPIHEPREGAAWWPSERQKRSSERSSPKQSLKGKVMRYVLVILAVAGIVVSSLALQAHYSTRYLELPCDINSVWSCGLVNHSRYAVVLGVPVALIGILGYAVLAATAWL